MNYKSFKNTINYFYPKLFQFSYTLVKSEVKANSLALKALQAFLIKFSSEDELSTSFFSLWLKEVYFLAEKSNTLEENRDDFMWSKQGLIFLKYYLFFSLDEISFILNKDKNKIKGFFLQAREEISDTILEKGKCVFSQQVIALLDKKERERATDISWISKHIKKCEECHYIEREYNENSKLLKYSIDLIPAGQPIESKMIIQLAHIAGIQRSYFQTI